MFLNFAIICLKIDDRISLLLDKTQEGSTDIPWDDISAHPDRYYNSLEYIFPCKLSAPKDMNEIDLMRVTIYLAERPILQPFTFFKKSDVDSNLLRAARINQRPPINVDHDTAHQRGSIASQKLSRAASPQPAATAPTRSDLTGRPYGRPLIPSTLQQPIKPEPISDSALLIEEASNQGGVKRKRGRPTDEMAARIAPNSDTVEGPSRSDSRRGARQHESVALGPIVTKDRMLPSFKRIK